MGQEIELKFRAPPDALEALAETLGAGPPRTLTATYFDSIDHRLRAAGLSLRLREEGGRRVQTAKSAAAGLLGREEVEVESTASTPDLHAPGFKPLRTTLEGAPLVASSPSASSAASRASRATAPGSRRPSTSAKRRPGAAATRSANWSWS